MSNIVLNAKTYNGAGIRTNGVAEWYERSSGLAAGFSKADLSLRLSDGKWRGLGRITLPIMVDSDSACGCEGDLQSTSDAQFSFRIDPKASPATRTDLRLRLIDFLASDEAEAMFDNLQFPTG